ncbi:phenylacetate--CoA ligase [Actinomadura alba]|uniref:Phenylacetate-coenzyme A ligase n=2 Tax=Actinomadura alba TaxID=406431 RepID=A0ABR7M3W8_9ACTN|nr:phenylacetate--CoA ligase [Actinomadura alba]
MSHDERAALQTDLLRRLVDRLLEAGGEQAGRLRAGGVTSGRDVELDSLPRLPTTGKQDLWSSYPLGMLAVPREEVVAIHGSSGTGGRPTLVGYTRADLALWARLCARSLVCAGASPSSVIHNAYGYGLFTGGLGIHQGAVELGATVVPLSGGMTSRQLRLLVDLEPDVLTCTPTYAVRLGEAAMEAGIEPGRLRLKVGIFGAEPWSEALRTQIEELLGLKALDIYGLSEILGPGVAVECVEAGAGLHVQEDHFLVETVDPESGEPAGENRPGELVFTTLTKEALPLLRYRTGDIATLSREPCVCGRTLVRMSKVLGRRDDMLVVRGVNVYPSEVEQELLSDPRLAPHYVIVMDRRGPTRLIVACEQVSGGDGVQAEVEGALADRLGVRADVRVLPAGAVPRTEVGKAVRVLTWSEGAPPLAGLG